MVELLPDIPQTVISSMYTWPRLGEKIPQNFTENKCRGSG